MGDAFRIMATRSFGAICLWIAWWIAGPTVAPKSEVIAVIVALGGLLATSVGIGFIHDGRRGAQRGILWFIDPEDGGGTFGEFLVTVGALVVYGGMIFIQHKPG